MVDIVSNNYLALVLALFVGQTPALIAAMYFTLGGHYNIFLVLLSSLFVTALWDLIWYGSGAAVSRGRLGTLSKLPVVRHGLRLVHSAYERRPFLTLFLARFMYGLSSAATVAAGWKRIDLCKFIMTSLASMTAWFGLLLVLSIGIRQGVESAQITARNISLAFPVFFAVMLLLYWGGRILLRRMSAFKDPDMNDHE